MKVIESDVFFSERVLKKNASSNNNTYDILLLLQTNKTFDLTLEKKNKLGLNKICIKLCATTHVYKKTVFNSKQQL